MNIEIKIKPKGTIRAQQFDDYYFKDGVLVFEVADLGNDFYNKLVLIHAIIEQALTEYKGIKEEEITKFDMEHLDSEEPGLEMDCVYRNEHLLAEGIERILCAYLNIPWTQYEEVFNG